MATTVVSFSEWISDLEGRCEEWLGIRTIAEPTGGHPKDFDTKQCICCHGQPDFVLVRLSFCFCHTSIRYGICSECKDTSESERLIEDEMEQAYRRGERDTPEEFQHLIDEAFHQAGFVKA
jgi:hypothetical protein